MKTLMALTAFLFSFSALALNQEGLVKNVIEDDEGIKIVFAGVAEKAGAAGIQTVYIQNSQSDFDSVKQTIMLAKSDGAKVVISKSGAQQFKVIRAGK